jgi:asparagine synthase (glutamine-hydrolysing)
MMSPDRQFALVFNGEIYNYRDIRDTLKSRGYEFKSSGDTEVVLYGLIEFGADLLTRMNGIFALAFWDMAKRELLLARDQVGVKPLYYTTFSDGALIFASELKALLAHPEVPRRLDPEVLTQHLVFCHSCSDNTILQGIKRLPPGSFMKWDDKKRRLEISQFWKPRYEPKSDMPRNDAVLELRSLLREATSRQMISDVPVGLFLSGGLDSALISALAKAEASAKSLKAFTITYPPSHNTVDRLVEDAPYARFLAQRLAIDQEEEEITPEIATLWPSLIYHLDEPLADPAAIAAYMVCRRARAQGFPVLLSGQGADELFAGYPRYQALTYASMLDGLPQFTRTALGAVSKLLPEAGVDGGVRVIRRTRRFLTSLAQTPDERFLSFAAPTAEKAALAVLSDDFRNGLRSRKPGDTSRAQMEAGGLNGTDRWLNRDFTSYLPNHNLLYMDKMGMAASVEVRVPLLDMELVNRVNMYPDTWKVTRGTTKSILRDAARGIVPDEIIDRPKAGFGAPYKKWLRDDLHEMWEDLTAEGVVKRRGWFDYESLKSARALSQSGKRDLYMLQWAVLTVELWARQLLDRAPA